MHLVSRRMWRQVQRETKVAPQLAARWGRLKGRSKLPKGMVEDRAVSRRGRGVLAAGHAVDEVVDQDHQQIHVAARGVDEVVAADPREVAVAGEHHHLELGPPELEPGGEGDGAAVGGVEGVEVHVAGDPAGAADAGDDGRLVEIDPGFAEGAWQST